MADHGREAGKGEPVALLARTTPRPLVPALEACHCPGLATCHGPCISAASEPWCERRPGLTNVLGAHADKESGQPSLTGLN